MGYKIAVIGATGNVGREILNELALRDFPYTEVTAIASDRSAGKEVSFGEDEVLKAIPLNTFDPKGYDFVFASAGATVSKDVGKKIANAGAVYIDNSSAFRMDKDVPLVVPEVNPKALSKIERGKGGIIANPNCVAIPLSLTLHALESFAPVKRVVASTYQSVSGAGQEAMQTLYAQTKQLLMGDTHELGPFTHQIGFSLIPMIDTPNSEGITGEEAKIEAESQKIIGHPFGITATSVRVPVFIGHCIAANITFETDKDIDLETLSSLFNKQEGLTFHESNDRVVTPKDVAGDEDVHVSRLRKDPSDAHSINCWIASDNLKKGAAQNAVQIAETLLEFWES